MKCVANLSATACWPYLDPGGPEYDEHNYELAKWTLLKVCGSKFDLNSILLTFSQYNIVIHVQSIILVPWRLKALLWM